MSSTAVASPTYDAILNACVNGLSSIKAPPSGVTTTQYLRFVKRYMGERFDAEQFGDRGGAGRTPGAFVAFIGERPFRGTMGGRRSRVEATIGVICVSDSRRSRDDRKAVFGPLYDVRRLLGGRNLGLAMTPLRYTGIVVVAENDAVYAHAARFTTRYAVNYATHVVTDQLIEADGQIVYPPTDPNYPTPVAPAAPTVVVNGTPGTANYAYDLQYKDANGIYSNFSPWQRVTNAPNTLGGANTLGVSWPAVPGATQYRLRRRWAPAGVTVGIIFTGTGTSFSDDGSVVANNNVEPARGETLKDVFP